MPIAHIFGKETQRLLKALGLEGVPVTKVVIELDALADGSVKVYVQSLATNEQVAALADAFEGIKFVPAECVIVDKKGNVLAG